MLELANPGNFIRFVRHSWPLLLVAGMLALGLGIYQSLLESPTDYQQGDFVRIMYVHVPAAWMALGLYLVMAIAGMVYLAGKIIVADIVAQAIAPIGASFAFICLVTGMLWGKPIWGTYWVWDARLTSMLVLQFFYFGYIALRGAFGDSQRGAAAASIVALAGAVNLPIVKFSVEWWNSLHQKASVFKMSGSSIHPDMQKPLLLMFMAFAMLSACAIMWRAAAMINLRLTTRRSG
jgi:heme exporter protein C